MLSKEQGIVSLGICATFDVILHWEVFWTGLCSFLKTTPTVPPAVNANDTEQVVLKDKLSIGEVVEERNGYHANVGDNINVKCNTKLSKGIRDCSGKCLTMSALAKRLGNFVMIYSDAL